MSASGSLPGVVAESESLYAELALISAQLRNLARANKADKYLHQALSDLARRVYHVVLELNQSSVMHSSDAPGSPCQDSIRTLTIPEIQTDARFPEEPSETTSPPSKR